MSPYPLTTSVTLRFGWGKESTSESSICSVLYYWVEHVSQTLFSLLSPQHRSVPLPSLHCVVVGADKIVASLKIQYQRTVSVCIRLLEIPLSIFRSCGDGRARDVYIVEERQERLRKFSAKVVILSAFEHRKGIQDPCAMEHSLQTQCKHVSLALVSKLYYVDSEVA